MPTFLPLVFSPISVTPMSIPLNPLMTASLDDAVLPVVST